MKKTSSVRALCLVLLAAMLFNLAPFSAFAETTGDVVFDDTVIENENGTTGEPSPEDPDKGEDEEEEEDDGLPDYSNPVGVSSSNELEQALANGASAIRIDQDFALDRTFFVTSDVIIIADEARTLTRDPAFGGDLFVIGENQDGTATETPVVFILGKHDDTTPSMITIDGNSHAMTVDVVGSVIFVRKGSRADLYHNVTMTNHVKVGNERALNTEYNLSYPIRIGGAVAIVSSGASMRIFGGLYTENRVNDITDSSTDEGMTSSQGGAIYNYGSLDVYGGTFSNNHAGRGGALYNYRRMNIYSAQIKNNTASTLGGAIYVPASTAAYLYIGEENDVTDEITLFEGNVATSNGGAIYAQNVGSIKNALFVDNSSEDGNGGAISAGGMVLSFENTTFDSNTAAGGYGGAIYITGSNGDEDNLELTVNGTVFRNNTSARGGAIYMSGASRAYFSGVEFNENGSTAYGGAIYATNATISANGVKMTNSSTTSYGGAVALYNGSVASFNNLQAEGNTAKLGGFSYVTASTLDVYNSEINTSEATENGGAVYAATDAVFNAYNSKFNANKASGNGGALMIYNGGTNSVIHSCSFSENVAEGVGGAMYISNKSQVQMYNITAEKNQASKGGFLYETTSGTVVHLVGLSVTGNVASDGGAIIWGNTVNAKLYIDKIKYVDNDYNGDWNDAYWASAIYNKLTVYDQVGTVPSYEDYNGQIIEPAVPVSITNVNTAAQLERALQVGYTLIRITGDFMLDRTFYVLSDATIFADEAHTLTRDPAFGGDIFVVGRDAKGKLTKNEVVFSLGKKDGTDAPLTIDGNQANMTVDVVGTVVLVSDDSRADLCEKLTITNNKKVGNDRLIGSDRVSYPARVGGAVAIVELGAELNLFGGVYSNNTTNDITDANTDAGSTSSHGGAFYNHGTMNIYGGTITNNHAGRGGAIYNYRTLRIYSATFSGNSSSTYGGAIYTPNSTGAFLYTGEESELVENGTILFSENVAAVGGGALYIRNFASIKNASFVGNSATSSYGGAIYAGSTRMTIEDTDFVKNTAPASYGGAIYLTGSNEREDVPELAVYNTTFDENTAKSRAGAIYMSGSARAYFEDTAFTGNSTVTGGVFYLNSASIELNGVTISDNKATTGNGGVMYLTSSAHALLNNVTATGNTSGGSSAVAYVGASTLEIYNSVFANNTAKGTSGVAYIAEGSSIHAYNTVFRSNTAGGNGGALVIYSGAIDSLLHSCTFDGNQGGDLGGGLYVSNKSQVTMYNLTATNNTAPKGGFLYETAAGTVITIVGLTVSGNTATTGGPIIWGNTVNAKLYIDKTKYTDLDRSGEFDSAYWSGAIYNKLTVYETTGEIPKYLDYGNEAYDHMADAVDVATAAELEAAINAGVKHIRIVADFELDRTFFITGDVTIFTTIAHTLTRAADFGSDIFIIGEDKDGNSSLLTSTNAKLTLGNPLSTQENLLVIDGNKDNMTVDVVGTVLLICQSSSVDLHTNVTVQNCHKVGNERTFDEHFGVVSIPNRVGGPLAIIASGTLNIYGGNYRNNSVNDEIDSTEEGRNSSVGGLIFNYSNLRILGGTFENNRAGRGGVIYSYRITRILGGSFIGNYASTSGGVYYAPNSAQIHLYVNNPDLTGDAVLFENNSAAKSGGVIYASTLSANVIYGNASFIGNSATSGSGGAICMYGQLTVRDSVFDGNTASNRGGAIYASHSSADDAIRHMELTDCTFKNNEASLGGAFSLFAGAADFPQGAIANVTDCTFQSNAATLEIGGASNANGGAIYTDRCVSLTIKGSKFTGNSASTEAGAIYVAGESSVSVSDSTFKDNSAGKYGGAFAVRSSYLDLANTEISNSTAVNNGGAIYVSYQSEREINSKITITDSLFKKNSTGSNGGAIYATRRNIEDAWNILTATNTTFEENTAGKNGGALYTLSNVGVYMENVTFSGNDATTAEDGAGGAMYAYGSKVEINGATFSGNASATKGGALFMESSASVIANKITANANEGTNGGFAYVTDKSSFTVYDSEFTNNAASTSGGAIYAGSSKTTLSVYDSAFNGNTAGENGGAVMIYNGGSNALIQNCSFQENVAENTGGAFYVSNKSQVSMYDITATANTAAKGGFMYETTSGTVVTLAGLTVSGNTATDGGPIIWGNTANAKLIIDKSKYVDTNASALDDAYWDGAIVNLLTVESATVSIPSYTGYVHVTPTTKPAAAKPVVSVDHIFELAQNSSDDRINATYESFPVLDNSSNFMSDGTTYFENINGETVTVDSFVYDTYATDGNVNVGQGILIYQAMLYKQAHPDEEVSIAISSYRFSIEAALNINRNSRYFGYMRNLYGMDYDKYGFVRLSYLLVSAAKMGINVTVIGHIDGYPISTADPNLHEYFTGHMDTPCDPSYTNGVVGDYLTFAPAYWTLEGKGGTDMMHNKMCTVSHYLDMNGVVHKNAVFSSSANLDGINSKGYNGNWKLQTGTIVSDHEEIYRIAYNYMMLLVEYSAQEKLYELQDLMSIKGAEQIELILAGKGDQIPADEQIVYLGTENDPVFELYFTPFAGDTSVWNETYNPYCRYIRAMYDSEDSIIFSWNAAEYTADFTFGHQMEAFIAGSFHKNKNVENKFFGNMESFDTSLMTGLTVGKDIGYYSINEYPFGKVHNKDILLSYVKDGQRYYVSLLNSCNMHSGSMYYQSNFMLVIKETSGNEGSVFFTMADLSTTGLVEHTYGEEQLYLPEDGSHGYYFSRCLYCDKTITHRTVHRPGEWIVDREATSEVNGIQHKECTVCGSLTEVMETAAPDEAHQKVASNANGMTFSRYEKIKTDVAKTPLTMEAVIELSPKTEDRGGVIVGNYDGVSADLINLEVYNGGRLRLYVKNSGVVCDCVFDTDIRSDSPVHVAVTVENRTSSLFVNGMLVEARELTVDMPVISTPVSIGNDNRQYALQFFKGTIYSVALFEDARTPSEIRRDMLSLQADAQGLLYARSMATLKSNPSAVSDGKTFTANDLIALDPLSAAPATIEAIIHVPERFADEAGMIFGNRNDDAQFTLSIGQNGQPVLSVREMGTEESYVFNADIRSTSPVHVAVSFEGEKASLYVNGTLADTVTMKAALPEIFDGFYVGGEDDQIFKGTLYALGLYGTARSAAQILQDAVWMDGTTDDLLYLCYYNAYMPDSEKEDLLSVTFTEDSSISLETLPSAPRTIEALIRVAPGVQERQGVIVGNYDNGTGAQINLEIYNSGAVRLFYSIDGYRGNCLFYNVDVRSTEAKHIAITIEGKLVSLYMDGVLAATDSLRISLPNATENFKVGGDNREGNAQYFRGEIFSLTMYSDVRTPEEIYEDYLFVSPDEEDLIYSCDLNRSFYVIPQYRPVGQIYDGLTLDKTNVTTTPHTFEATVLLPTDFEGRGGVIVGNYVGGDSDQVSLEIYDQGQVRLFFVNNGVRTNAIFATDIRSDSPTHIAVSVDGMLATLYVNGTATETLRLPDTLPLGTTNYVVGGDNRYLNSKYFRGTIYSVALYDDARTAEEIAQDAALLCESSDGLLYSDIFARQVCTPYAGGLEHAESDWIIDLAATENENGLKHKECTVCGEITVQEEILAARTAGEGAHIVFDENGGFAPLSEADAISVGALSATPLTFEAMIQLDPSYADRAGVILGSYNGTSADGLNVEVYTNGKIRLYYKIKNVPYSYLFSTDVRSESMTHIALTIDGLTARLYVNGVKVEEVTLSALAPVTYDFNVGNDKRTNSGQYFKGTIWSVALFDHVRTDEEIRIDSLLVSENADGLLYSEYFVSQK